MTTELILKTIPKVLLHDHLDGGLRPQTIIELADEIKYKKLPTKDPIELGEWFHRGANKGNLVEYLQGFEHTTAVMQTKESLIRVAYEMMEDMKKDGVVYVETRFAPALHLEKGLYLEDTVKAVLEGLEKGKEDFGVGYGLILCGMRNMKNSLEIAELAVNFRRQGVVGFDLAGEEGGYPPKKHIDAFQFIQRANFNITIHAGEAFGKESIWQAIQWCGAHRIGHATRLIEDIVLDNEGNVVAFGDLAQYVLDKRIPLEICLLSNVHTGAVDKIENHPFGIFYREKFRVTLNTDDRLMSDTTMTKEFMTAVKYFNLNFDDFEKITINSMKSAFIPYKERLHYIYNVIKPGYQKMREQILSFNNIKGENEKVIQ
ncbi:Adenosine deaminase [Ignavibacterium album JCM 16511]|uniref:Adenosine deaminase n=1 Tax=Ignavibacterium album (strain DSM 19864 / JCM 16511 / NBRC 101810 / Mat9-16) TaxID=945713 RepID=I0AHP0_IGNAJ|nr:adenosine deaminase [Ignavibacterium album]AFH48497.1 Adenosine deaminase [Ignavibacterium album JCM 16511]